MWRYKVSPQIQRLVRIAEGITDCPGVWPAGCKLLEQFDIENPKMLFDLRQHLVQHSTDCGECPSQLGIQDLTAEIDQWTPHVGRWSWHWWHAHQLTKEMQEMRWNPAVGTLYCCLDFQDTTRDFSWKTTKQ